MTDREKRQYEANKEWWNKRQLNAQDNLTGQSEKAIRKQLTKYYDKAAKNLVGQFKLIYLKVMSDNKEGYNPTPADLYKLDSYWNLQAQIKEELQKLGDKQTTLYLERFTQLFKGVYESLPFSDGGNFSTLDKHIAEQMIKQIWCADGKTWSDRVWNNIDNLQQTLNDDLIECLLNGYDTNRLKERLMFDFNVSYNRADTLVRTEITHIQTQATRQRYADEGIKEVYVWADKDERRCDVCGKLHEKRFLVGETMPIPAHPKCRCRILPVLE